MLSRLKYSSHHNILGVNKMSRHLEVFGSIGIKYYQYLYYFNMKNSIRRVKRTILGLLLIIPSLFYFSMFSYTSDAETLPNNSNICKCFGSSDGIQVNDDYNKTFCSPSAYQRGSNQKVISYSLFGDVNSVSHLERRYFEGIQGNLRLMRRL